MKRIYLGPAVAALCLLAGCGGSSVTEGRTLQLAARGIEPLQNGFHYEGWAIFSGQPVSTGKFNVDSAGRLVDLAGVPIPNQEFTIGRDLMDASHIVLTIEPAGDTDAIPSATKYLAGALSGGRADLNVAAPQALGDSFASAAGTFVLATPTDGENANETSGVWFLKIDGAPMTGLTLPTLPAGWVYEGWIVVNGTPLSTGRFVNPAAADSAAPFSGPMAGPPFPGEDLLANAPAGLNFPTNLADGSSMAVISIEPDADDSPAPFTLKPLLAPIAAGAADHTNLALGNRAATFPTMTAQIR